MKMHTRSMEVCFKCEVFDRGVRERKGKVIQYGNEVWKCQYWHGGIVDEGCPYILLHVLEG